MLAQRGDDRRGVFAGHFDQHDETRVPFHQGCDMSVFAACKQVALPMTGNGAVFNLRWSFADRDRINDLTAGLSCSRARFCPTVESSATDVRVIVINITLDHVAGGTTLAHQNQIGDLINFASTNTLMRDFARGT